MLKDFIWNMTGYIPKHQVNPHGDGIIPYVAERIFQLEPEPPAVDSLNEYILSALQEKNLIYFSFFLHHYEPQLNKRIKDFLGVDGGDLYDTDRFIDIKLSCREQMLQKLMDYDPAKGAKYATYIFPFIRDAMLRFRMGEEKWSVSSLTNYKMVRSMAWLYHNSKDAVSEFAKKYNCDLALAEEYLKVVRGIRNQQPFYVTDEDGEETGEDVTCDDSWDYADILWNGVRARAVKRAFWEMELREQRLLEGRNAICMACGRVSPMSKQKSFEELAVMFEGSGASGAERAYRRALDKLRLKLMESGMVHTVTLKQVKSTKKNKKIAAAVYLYQADNDGGWGELRFDFATGTAEIVRLAEWDTVKSNVFARTAIRYIQSLLEVRLLKEAVVPFEMDGPEKPIPPVKASKAPKRKALRTISLRQIEIQKTDERIAAAVYQYQVDNDGEWGEIRFDFATGTAEIVRLAEWDTIKSNIFARAAIRHIHSLPEARLPKERVVTLDVD